jgi:surface protein
MTVNANLDYDTHKSYSFTVYATNDVGDSNKVTIEMNVYQVRTGRLVDSGVMGADYITDTKRYDDITERDGTFTYDTRDKNITFTLGDLIIVGNFDLTKINSDGMILPVDIVVDKDGVSLDRNNTTNKNLIKLLRVFQSLDEDSDPTNDIEITQDTKNKLTKSENILDMNISEIKDMVENDVGKTFIRQKKARIHYIEKLRALGIDPELMKFITVWETANDDDEITIKVNTGKYDYDLVIDWGDGNTETYEDSTISSDKITHKYTSKGNHTVEISGDFPYIDASSEIRELSQWGDIVWENFTSSFEKCDTLNVNATDTPDLRNVTSLAKMFFQAWDFTGNKYFNEWDVSNVTNMSKMFYELYGFNQPLNDWDVSNVTNMNQMFNGSSNFNQPLNNWDISSVTDMNGMFGYAFSFNGDIGDWNISSVSDAQDMFNTAMKFNQPLNNWDVSGITNMKGMFAGANEFNQPLNDWNVSSVTNMQEMFMSAGSFNQPLDKWDVSSVTTMNTMFKGAKVFNQDIGDWKTGNVTNMNYMFNKAEEFKNQDLQRWDVNNVPSDKHKDFMYKSGGGNKKPNFP